MTWKAEFDRFTQEALQEMKTYSDNTNEEREWMSYVYLDDDDNYQLGLPDYGGESAMPSRPGTMPGARTANSVERPSTR